MPVPVPFTVPELVFMQVWHPRAECDKAQIWLRDIVGRALVKSRKRTRAGS
jgi:hypothetical protein